MFAYFNPIQLCMDHLTVLWLNAFALNLQRSVKMLAVEQTEPPYLDVKIEAIMLRVRFYMITLNGRSIADLKWPMWIKNVNEIFVFVLVHYRLFLNPKRSIT